MQRRVFVLYKSNNEIIQDAYDMLAARIHTGKSEELMKTVAITSCKPGEGRTSLTVNLGIALAASGLKVLLVDSDMRKPNKAKRLSNEIVLGFSEVLLGKLQFNDAVGSTNIHNLFYLPSGSCISNPLSLLCSEQFTAFMAAARDEYDLVLFDTPALSNVTDGAVVASKADGALMVVKMREASLSSLMQSKAMLEGLDAKIFGVVLNRLKKREYAKYFQSYNYFRHPERFKFQSSAKKTRVSMTEQVVQDAGKGNKMQRLAKKVRGGFNIQQA